eukprot:CAMPEP_0119046722 /NCGR_PEP_ID=MMETSP1177-20130426/48508_1 /TAXON_ID=2985 /ORGANISM="Ochromonas sp, Strain CCMP1899" /LENGTH=540 /DNA_ID=CAMNT_0007020297 /DNA_START=42 /DNA_END=1665 /DNA_ORIENTATION=+
MTENIPEMTVEEIAPVLERRWIKDQMKKRQNEFCDPALISIFTGSWNVNNKLLDDKEGGGLSDWLLPNDQFVADVFAVGFQETVELSTINVVFDGTKSSDRAVYWQKKISETFIEKELEYVLIDEKHLVGNLLCVYVKAALAPFIKGVRGAVTPVGIMGVMGNKGAVVVRMTIHNTSICFVCSHLSANRDNIVGRNNDFKNINEKTLLYPSMASLIKATSIADMSPNTLSREQYKTLTNAWSNETALPLSINEHDIVFWFGDLNYRINEIISTQLVFDTVWRGEFKSLLHKDQLNNERLAGNVFEDYEEGTIDFEPTYKFAPGTSQYDNRPEKKLRAPAWCDRVLWRTNSLDSVRQLNYRRCELDISDHKPVSALFNIDTGITDPERERTIYTQLLSKVDKWVNASAPKLSVEDRVIDYGVIVKQEKKSSIMVIKNVGQVLTSWQFVPKPDESVIAFPWLHFSSLNGILAPGEEAEVTVTICINALSYDSLLEQKEVIDNVISLEDMLLSELQEGATSSVYSVAYYQYLVQAKRLIQIRI